MVAGRSRRRRPPVGSQFGRRILGLGSVAVDVDGRRRRRRRRLVGVDDGVAEHQRPDEAVGRRQGQQQQREASQHLRSAHLLRRFNGLLLSALAVAASSYSRPPPPSSARACVCVCAD